MVANLLSEGLAPAIVVGLLAFFVMLKISGEDFRDRDVPNATAYRLIVCVSSAQAAALFTWTLMESVL